MKRLVRLVGIQAHQLQSNRKRERASHFACVSSASRKLKLKAVSVFIFQKSDNEKAENDSSEVTLAIEDGNFC